MVGTKTRKHPADSINPQSAEIKKGGRQHNLRLRPEEDAMDRRIAPLLPSSMPGEGVERG